MMTRLRATLALGAGIWVAACSAQASEEQTAPEVRALLDRVAIEDMVVEYYAHLGGEDAGAFDEYFTPDAVFDVNGTIANGREEIEALYAGMREAGESAASEPGVFRMILSNPVITVDGDRATASFVWTGIRNVDIAEPPVFVEQGREYDRLVKLDGEWKFAHRVVIADSGLPQDQYEAWSPRRDFSFGD